MTRIILAIALLASAFLPGDVCTAQTSAQAPAAAVQPGPRAEPLLVLIEYDPWAMVIGSDSPRLVLYDDGVVIYRKEGGYRALRLEPDDIAAALASLKPEAVGRLAGSYVASSWTDQPTTDILLRTGSTYARVSVYGSFRSDGVRAALPSEIVDLYQRLSEFDRPDASAWLPAFVEVVIWPYEYAPDESIVWPEDWPGLSHASTLARGDGYSLYVPSAEYTRLRDFLRTRQQKGAVLVGDRKWAAQIRLPFPKEERWMESAEINDPAVPSTAQP
jgi:hypothetical protein